jgi:RNA-binding protein Musashi
VFSNRAAKASESNMSERPIDADKLFVGGLPWGLDEGELRSYFEQYGVVTAMDLMKDRVTGEPRGFGFLTFEEVDTVNKVSFSR